MVQSLKFPKNGLVKISLQNNKINKSENEKFSLFYFDNIVTAKIMMIAPINSNKPKEIFKKIIDKIIEEKKIVKMVVSGTPIIVSENIYGSQDIMGNKYWQMRVPVIVTTESGRTEVASGYVNLMIVFQATDDNPSGFYISQIVSEF